MNNETIKNIEKTLEELKSKADIMYDKIQERESFQDELSYKAKKNFESLKSDYTKLEEDIIYYSEELNKINNLESRINLFDKMMTKSNDIEKEELSILKEEAVKEYNDLINYHESSFGCKKEEIKVNKEEDTIEEIKEDYEELKFNSNEVADECLNDVQEKNNLFNFDDDAELDNLIDESLNESSNKIEEKEEIKEVNNKDYKVNWKHVLAGALALSLVCNLVSCMKKNNSNQVDPVKPNSSVEDSLISNNDKEVAINDGLVKEISKFDTSLSNTELKLKAENLIKVYSGELPLDINGNVDWEPSTLAIYDEYVCNYADRSMNEDSKVFNYSNLVQKNSAEYKFIKKYDDLYNNIKNSKSEKEAYNLMVELGTNMFDDWIMGGQNKEVNPYTFSAGGKVVALDATLTRYFGTVVEYENSTGINVCVPVCHDYCSGKTTNIHAGEIFDALAYGANNNVSLMQYANGGGKAGSITLSEEFYNQLNDNLKQKYNDYVIRDSVQMRLSK